jgi:hypothetical protein
MTPNMIAALTRRLALAAIALCATAVSAQPVVNANVVNTPTVRSADEPARNAFQALLCTVAWPAGCGNLPSQVVVPTGKRLVIEFVSGQCLTGSDSEKIAYATLTTTVGSSGAIHYFVPMAAPGSEGARTSVFSQPVRIYADGGRTVDSSAASTNGNVGCLISLSGYLVTR